jgi:riboflavin synthase
VFAGIVEGMAVVTAVRGGPAGSRLEIDLGPVIADSPLGASVAVNGCCLTLAEKRGGIAAFDVVAETLQKTTLGGLRAGQKVNFERSLCVGDRIDGHFVQGHVEGVGRVVRNGGGDGAWRLRVRAAEAVRPCLIPKGAICIDGVSLTIASLDGDEFEIALIPTTIERTTLGRLRPGDGVNLESDILVRTILARLATLEESSGGLTLESLRAAGFAS